MNREIRIGVDTGGTFTDFAIYQGGKIRIKKILSVPRNPSVAILDGIREFLDQPGLMVIHGSTVATNALLERKGARIALITTKGFEDILFIGRQVRKDLYSLRGERRMPLLSRHLCFGLDERTQASGKVEKAVSLDKLGELFERMRKARVEAVAVSFINSYANPANEKVVEKELKKRKILASISTSILPEYREYERTAATAVNAYLMPIINAYLFDLEKKTRKAELRIMQSNEGYISPRRARLEPIRTALSGPAGGVVGALHLAKLSGFRNIITFDMGGTSTDVSLIDGQIRRTNESVIGDFPVRIPIIDIHSVGAGGGSLAIIDRGGSLRVGPQSAAADPGPACYGRAVLPTVTDANLVLGRLDPASFLGGEMKIYPERSFEALSRLARKANKSVVETAEGIIGIANANMEKAIRVISIERGIDPRSFALFSFGGAGGMHAAEITSSLNMKTIIVPKNAGVLSALGLLLADSIKDYSRSVLKSADKLSGKELESLFSGLDKKGLKDMADDGFRESMVSLFRYLDLRYLGQSYEITIPYRKSSNSRKPFAFVSDFHRAHERLYTYSHPKRIVEVVNLRVKAVGRTKKVALKKLPEAAPDSRKAIIKEQPVTFSGKKRLSPVFDRNLLEPGNRIKGPALVIDFGSTTVVPPSFRVVVDGLLNLVMEREG